MREVSKGSGTTGSFISTTVLVLLIFLLRSVIVCGRYLLRRGFTGGGASSGELWRGLLLVIGGEYDVEELGEGV